MSPVSKVTGYVLAGAAGLSLVVAVWSGVQSRAYVACQARWSQAYAASAQERTLAAEVDRQALDAMVAAVASATSAAQSRAALQRYQDARAAADAQRAEHPAPALPDEVCH